MSKLSSSDCATRLTSAASRLTPRLILPDFTTMAREVTLLITASSDAESPVVPMTWTRPRSAAIATLAMVAAGHGEIQNAVGIGRQRPQIGRELDAVFGQAREHAGILAEQRGTRRFQRAGQHGARRFRDDARQRAAHPAAGPRNDQTHVGHGSTSLRPIAGGRPFRQPTGAACQRGLRAVVALDDHEVALANAGCGTFDQMALIFRRVVAGERGLVVLEFEHHVARARRAFPAPRTCRRAPGIWRRIS